MKDSDAFNKYVNILAAGCNTCKSSGNNCNSKAKCNAGCNSCSCDSGSGYKCKCAKKLDDKPRSSSAQDDGCFCRKCNAFLTMVEPDNVGDGKSICYDCANPW
jgi:hypothetical protein